METTLPFNVSVWNVIKFFIIEILLSIGISENVQALLKKKADKAVNRGTAVAFFETGWQRLGPIPAIITYRKNLEKEPGTELENAEDGTGRGSRRRNLIFSKMLLVMMNLAILALVVMAEFGSGDTSIPRDESLSEILSCGISGTASGMKKANLDKGLKREEVAACVYVDGLSEASTKQEIAKRVINETGSCVEILEESRTPENQEGIEKQIYITAETDSGNLGDVKITSFIGTDNDLGRALSGEPELKNHIELGIKSWPYQVVEVTDVAGEDERVIRNKMILEPMSDRELDVRNLSLPKVECITYELASNQGDAKISFGFIKPRQIVCVSLGRESVVYFWTEEQAERAQFDIDKFGNYEQHGAPYSTMADNDFIGTPEPGQFFFIRSHVLFTLRSASDKKVDLKEEYKSVLALKNTYTDETLELDSLVEKRSLSERTTSHWASVVFSSGSCTLLRTDTRQIVEPRTMTVRATISLFFIVPVILLAVITLGLIAGTVGLRISSRREKSMLGGRAADIPVTSSQLRRRMRSIEEDPKGCNSYSEEAQFGLIEKGDELHLSSAARSVVPWDGRFIGKSSDMS